jgi:hypothetical protein
MATSLSDSGSQIENQTTTVRQRRRVNDLNTSSATETESDRLNDSLRLSVAEQHQQQQQQQLPSSSSNHETVELQNVSIKTDSLAADDADDADAADVAGSDSEAYQSREQQLEEYLRENGLLPGPGHGGEATDSATQSDVKSYNEFTDNAGAAGAVMDEKVDESKMGTRTGSDDVGKYSYGQIFRTPSDPDDPDREVHDRIRTAIMKRSLGFFIIEAHSIS